MAKNSFLAKETFNVISNCFSVFKINNEDNIKHIAKFVLANNVLVVSIVGFKTNFTMYVTVFGDFSTVAQVCKYLRNVAK